MSSLTVPITTQIALEPGTEAPDIRLLSALALKAVSGAFGATLQKIIVQAPPQSSARRAVAIRVADQVFKLLVHHIVERSCREIVSIAFDYSRRRNGRPIRGVRTVSGKNPCRTPSRTRPFHPVVISVCPLT